MKDVYSIYKSTYGNIQIRVNQKTEIKIIAVVTVEGNGQYSTNQTRKQGLKVARKIVKVLNS